MLVVVAMLKESDSRVLLEDRRKRKSGPLSHSAILPPPGESRKRTIREKKGSASVTKGDVGIRRYRPSLTMRYSAFGMVLVQQKKSKAGSSVMVHHYSSLRPVIGPLAGELSGVTTFSGYYRTPHSQPGERLFG